MFIKQLWFQQYLQKDANPHKEKKSLEFDDYFKWMIPKN